MTSTDILHGVRPDLAGLDDRTEALRKELVERAEVTREQLARLATEVGGEVAARASSLGEELGERAHVAREVLAERYHELEHDPRVQEAALQARIGAWKALRTGLAALFTLPALIVRALGGLSTVVDDVAERGADLSERGRELAAAVPPSKSERRRSRLRTVAVGLIGFAVGVVIGRLWAAGTEPQGGYGEPPLLFPTDGQSEAASQDGFDTSDVGSEAISPDEPDTSA